MNAVELSDAQNFLSVLEITVAIASMGVPKQVQCAVLQGPPDPRQGTASPAYKHGSS